MSGKAGKNKRKSSKKTEVASNSSSAGGSSTKKKTRLLVPIDIGGSTTSSRRLMKEVESESEDENKMDQSITNTVDVVEEESDSDAVLLSTPPIKSDKSAKKRKSNSGKKSKVESGNINAVSASASKKNKKKAKLIAGDLKESSDDDDNDSKAFNANSNSNSNSINADLEGSGDVLEAKSSSTIPLRSKYVSPVKMNQAAGSFSGGSNIVVSVIAIGQTVDSTSHIGKCDRRNVLVQEIGSSQPYTMLIGYSELAKYCGSMKINEFFHVSNLGKKTAIAEQHPPQTIANLTNGVYYVLDKDTKISPASSSQDAKDIYDINNLLTKINAINPENSSASFMGLVIEIKEIPINQGVRKGLELLVVDETNHSVFVTIYQTIAVKSGDAILILDGIVGPTSVKVFAKSFVSLNDFNLSTGLSTLKETKRLPKKDGTIIVIQEKQMSLKSFVQGQVTSALVNVKFTGFPSDTTSSLTFNACITPRTNSGNTFVCNKKVSPQYDAESGNEIGFYCAAHHFNEQYTIRYAFKALFTDAISGMEGVFPLSLFDEAGTSLFGMTANEVADISIDPKVHERFQTAINNAKSMTIKARVTKKSVHETEAIIAKILQIGEIVDGNNKNE